MIVAVVGGSSSRFRRNCVRCKRCSIQGNRQPFDGLRRGNGHREGSHSGRAGRTDCSSLPALANRLVTVVIAGRAYCIEDIENASNALLYAFYPGPMGGKAVAEMLYGTTNPSGRLPVSMPRHAGQIPVCYNYRTSVVPAYCDMTSQPLHTFGEGKSYTTFAVQRCFREQKKKTVLPFRLP